MGGAVMCQERALFLMREMADFEHRLDVLRRDRHRVSRICNLRHKRPVFAKRRREPLACARWPVIHDKLQQSLVGNDGIGDRRGIVIWNI